jgi:glycine cleavage system H protein
VSEETRRYLESHEWAALEGDVATVGISDFAVNHLSDLVFIQLPEVNDKVEAGETYGEVESVKAVSELNSPVSGEIIEVNESVDENLELVSNDPLGEGWLIKVKVSNSSDFESLLTEKEYRDQLEEEEDDPETDPDSDGDDPGDN